MSLIPDDETLGMGGTIVKLSKSTDVHLLIMDDGVTSRLIWSVEDVRIRQGQCTAAAKVLGVKSVKFLNYPDQRLDEQSFPNLVLAITAWLAQIDAEVVYTHCAGELNTDHRLTLEAVLVATRPVPGQHVHSIYSFEVPSSTEWGFGQFGAFVPNAFEDVTETIESKLKAIACYKAEVRDFPHPRSPEAIRARAQYWGSVVGRSYAEAFELIRMIRGGER